MPLVAVHRGARPPRTKRTAARLVRFTPDELNVVSARAHGCGRPVACYIRETALGKMPRAQRAQRSAELIRNLTHLGNRLGELGKAAREQQLRNAADFEVGLAELLDMIRQIE